MSHLAPLVYSSVIDSLSLRRRLVHAATPATRAGVPGFDPAGITNKVGCPLDKSEGGVKDKNILPVFLAPLFCQRGLRTKTLEISR